MSLTIFYYCLKFYNLLHQNNTSNLNEKHLFFSIHTTITPFLIDYYIITSLGINSFLFFLISLTCFEGITPHFQGQKINTKPKSWWLLYT